VGSAPPDRPTGTPADDGSAASGRAGRPDDLIERVLVVDDDPDTNRLLRVRLSARGYAVASAADGVEALARLDHAPTDLVFLDVSMPGMDGLEVLDRIRALGLDLAVVMTTALGSERIAVEALRRGADDYLRKPFERQEFQAVLERTVSRLGLQRQNAALRRQLDERRRQLEAELVRAAAIQAELLPRGTSSLEGYQLAARCVPAREVGGDFYDWEQSEHGWLTLSLGDVMGKGMPAALLMATVRAALRTVAPANPPAEAVGLTARALADDLDRSGSYLTLFHARLDVRAGHLTFVDAGHGHVFVVRGRRDGAPTSVDELGPRGLPLGIPFGEEYEEGSVQLRDGDALVLYSDGLTDARPDEAIDRHALAELLAGAGDAETMVERLVGFAVAELVGPPPDDLTVVVLRRAPG
jgi:serine phosphatase RsbU (regulator of sigma subunit)